MRLATREEVEECASKMKIGAPVSIGENVKGKLVAVLTATGSLLVECEGEKDVEVMLMVGHTIH